MNHHFVQLSYEQRASAGMHVYGTSKKFPLERVWRLRIASMDRIASVDYIQAPVPATTEVGAAEGGGWHDYCSPQCSERKKWSGIVHS